MKEQFLCYISEKVKKDQKLYKEDRLKLEKPDITVGELIETQVPGFLSLTTDKRINLLFTSDIGPTLHSCMQNGT